MFQTNFKNKTASDRSNTQNARCSRDTGSAGHYSQTLSSTRTSLTSLSLENFSPTKPKSKATNPRFNSPATTKRHCNEHYQSKRVKIQLPRGAESKR